MENKNIKNEVADFIEKKLATQMNLPMDVWETLDKTQYRFVKEVVATDKNGKEIKAVKALKLPSEEELKEISLVAELSKVSINDLLLKKYYLATIGGVQQIFKKYTKIVHDFKQDNPNAIVSFEKAEGGIICVLKNEDVEIRNFCGENEIGKTSRNKVDAMKTKAFKDILRYNYPQYVEFYDEYDEREMAQTEVKVEDTSKSDNLLEKLGKKLGA